MKKVKRTLLFTFAMCILIAGASRPAFSQSNKVGELASFMILVETTAEGFKLACEKGCAWKELSFALKPYKPQAIDQWGMTSLAKHGRATKDSNQDNFLFTIQKTEKDGVILESLEGTGWKKLGFQGPGPRSREYINASGTVEPEN